jgi:hypothetical protein
MKDETETFVVLAKAMGDTPKTRHCLRCGTNFWSEGFGERICGRCKSSVTWRAAVPHAGQRNGRRLSGRS